jgi:hypothetical protein
LCVCGTFFECLDALPQGQETTVDEDRLLDVCVGAVSVFAGSLAAGQVDNADLKVFGCNLENGVRPRTEIVVGCGGTRSVLKIFFKKFCHVVFVNLITVTLVE